MIDFTEATVNLFDVAGDHISIDHDKFSYTNIANMYLIDMTHTGDGEGIQFDEDVDELEQQRITEECKHTVAIIRNRI